MDNEHTVGRTDNTCRVVLDTDGCELLHIGMLLVDLVRIIKGIFISAIAISIILRKIHGTLSI